MTDLQKIAESLGCVKKTANGFECRCPLHADTNASCSLHYNDASEPEAFCHAGCDPHELNEYLRKTFPDVYPKKRWEPLPERVWKITTTDGKHSFEHVRIDKPEGKIMFWRPKLSDFGVKCRELELYRSADVKDSDREVTIHEGEKATDAGWKLGLCAVGTVTGAPAVPHDPAFIPLLRNKTVVLWPDNDDVGRNQAYGIGKRLTEYGIKWRAVEWPDAPPGGDCADFVAQGGTLEQFRAFPEIELKWVKIEKKPESEKKEKPRPKVNAGEELHQVVKSTMRILPSMQNLYQRGGKLVRIARISSAETDLVSKQFSIDKEIAESWIGTPVIREQSPSMMRFALSEAAIWERYDARSKSMISTSPSKDIATIICEFGEYRGVRPLRGIAVSPFMRPDGSVCMRKGYDRSTGYLYDPTIDFPSISQNPSKDDALNAFGILADLFSDFPFETREQAAVPIALMLSVLARPMFRNCPGFLIDAAAPGTGKTLGTDTASMIVNGKIVPKLGYPNGKEWQTEMDKVLAAIAIDAPSLVCLDNIRAGAKVGGTSIDRVITCNGATKFRILGKTEAPELPWNTILILNGNNSSAFVMDETRRRILPCRMVSDRERPEERTGFKHPNLLQWAEKNRAQLVVAALTVLRHWAINMPVFVPTWGSFEEWSTVIPNAILAAGGPNIMEALKLTQDVALDDDVAIVNVLKMLSVEFPDGATSQNISNEKNINVVEPLAAVLGSGFSSRSLGNFLAGKRDRVFSGLRLRMVSGHARQKKWWVENLKKESAHA